MAKHADVTVHVEGIPEVRALLDAARADALPAMQAQCWANSKRWFPELHERDPWDQVLHQTLGLAGEAGEVANVIKKRNRGAHPVVNEGWTELAHELADVAVYVMNVASLFGIDLATAIEEKQAICEQRWGKP